MFCRIMIYSVDVRESAPEEAVIVFEILDIKDSLFT